MHIGLFIKDFAVGKKFSKNGLPTKSGAEFHGENHALQLIRCGHDVTIMAKKRYWFTKARENIKGIDLVRLHGPFRWFEIIFRLLTTHRSIDVFYVLGKASFSVWAIVLAKLMKKPVTMALTGKAEIFNGGKSWRNKIFTKCDHYIALSNEIRDGFIQEGHISPDKITVLGQGIDTKKYPVPSDAEKATIRDKHGISAEAVVILFCARIVVDKGIDTVEKIWPEIHKKYPDARLILVGGGRNEIMEELKIMSKEQDASIIIIGETDVPVEYYQLSDIYLFPSKHEGLPTTLMEAMSCGLPTVASRIGGCVDLVEDSVNGYLVDKEDADGFAEKVEKLIIDGDIRKRMGLSAASFARENCDYSKVIWRLEEILKGK